MSIRRNARTTPYSRAENGTADDQGISIPTVAKRLAQHRREGENGLARCHPVFVDPEYNHYRLIGSQLCVDLG